MWSDDLNNLAEAVDELARLGGAGPTALGLISERLRAAGMGVAALEALPVPPAARPACRILPAGVADLNAYRRGGAL